MLQTWGPQCIFPSPLRRTCSGRITLSESLDTDTLRQDLVALELPTDIVRINNAWYYRKTNSENWLAIGESDDGDNGFPVEWDTTGLPNGRYEIIGLMSVVAREGISERTIAHPSFTEVVVRN